MDFSLNEEQQQIREMVHDLCLERVEPRAAEIDESGEFPWDVKELFAKHDILAIPFTPEYGGISGGALTLIVAGVGKKKIFRPPPPPPPRPVPRRPPPSLGGNPGQKKAPPSPPAAAATP